MSQSITLSPVQVDAGAVARSGAVTALVGAAAVHSTVISEHYEEWVLAGLFFLGLEVVQTFLAVALVLAWSRLAAVAVVASSAGTVAVWLLSRTVGMPVGPASLRAPESVGAADLACLMLEVCAAALVLPWALGRWRAAPVGRLAFRQQGTVLVAGCLVLAMAVVAGAGVRPAFSGGGEHSHGEELHAHAAP